MNFKRCIYITYIFLFCAMLVGYSQKEETLPPPQQKNDFPPVGLPLPIDDYIPFLFIVALSAGVYFYSKPDRNQVTNS
ncbi:hypothetical protein [Leeuwenhoekiella marinoflava]|uniref:hypothetical protein n=1 Tax=Leeuwenhoekiella marinoflava TaxID=988 RepID=UPI003002E308